MDNYFRTLLFWTLILCACSTSLPPTDATPPTSVPPSLAVTEEAPTYGRCAYQWTYKDMPELKKPFDEAIKAIASDAKAWATAFGEDCVYAAGQATFGAMETDFYIHLPVTDLSDFKSFGDWIAQAMNVVNGLPTDLMIGPKPGFVEFWFIKSDTEHVIVRVPIQTYRNQASGKSGEELFRLFF